MKCSNASSASLTVLAAGVGFFMSGGAWAQSSVTLYGIVDGEPAPQPPFGARLLRIRDLVEKPKPENAPSNLAITGRYVLPPAIFDCLERTKPGAGNEIQLTDGLRMLAQEQGLWAYIYEGITYDAGDKLGFLKATVELALQNQELGADFRSYLKTLKL